MSFHHPCPDGFTHHPFLWFGVFHPHPAHRMPQDGFAWQGCGVDTPSTMRSHGGLSLLMQTLAGDGCGSACWQPHPYGLEKS